MSRRHGATWRSRRPRRRRIAARANFPDPPRKMLPPRHRSTIRCAGATEFIDVSGTGIVIFGFCLRLCSGMRLIERGEFAQGLDQNGKRAGIAIALGRLLPDALEPLFDVAHLLFGGSPEPRNQLTACS